MVLSVQTAAACPATHLDRGFTLIELLVTMAIAGVLSMIAVPAMTRTLDSIKLSSASNVFVAGLTLARSEAIKRNGRVVLCKSASAELCSNTGGWDQGWIIFDDVNNDGLRQADETVIHRESALPSTVKLTGNLNVARYVSFTSTGATRLVGGGFQAGTLTICTRSRDSGDARQVVLNAVGRPRVYRATVAGCV